MQRDGCCYQIQCVSLANIRSVRSDNVACMWRVVCNRRMLLAVLRAGTPQLCHAASNNTRLEQRLRDVLRTRSA